MLKARASEMVERLLKVATEPYRVIEKEQADGTKVAVVEMCVMCGRGMPRSEDLQVRTMLAALDRMGIGPQSKVEVSQAPDASWMQYLTDEEFTSLAMLKSAADARMPARVQATEPEALPESTE